jgi:L1 cell adhesion molecule like protein
MTPVFAALSDAKLSPLNITDIVLVGGSSRIPKIHSLLRDIFGDKLRTDINADEAVAYGAAIQANILSAEADAALQEMLLIDITSMSVGIEIAGGRHKVMIPKNTPLPASHEEIFTTFMDNQPSVCIKVFEGESSTTKSLNLLGTFTLDNLPIRLKGQIHLHVKFEINADGIMNISATEKENGQSKKICINKK